MDTADILGLLHPAIAVAFVFPLIGMVASLAWQTRQRRVKAEHKEKTNIPAIVGSEHLKLGNWLTASVVGVALLGLAYAVFAKMIKNQTWTQEPLRVGFVLAMFAVTIASLVLLYQAKARLWRGIFATLTGMGLIIIGCQPEVFRRGYEWFTSHYYYGIAAALLMIFSKAVVQDIYQDRAKRWRRAHGVLNVIALLLFIGQGWTGARDLLEIPLNWQTPYVEQLYINQCNAQPCIVQPAPPEENAEPPAE